MGSEWHYTQNRQPAAVPVTTAQLKQLAEQGLLKPDDLVWQEGMSEWKPAGVIKGLFPAKGSASESRGITAAKTVTSEAPPARVTRSPSRTSGPANRPGTQDARGPGRRRG